MEKKNFKITEIKKFYQRFQSMLKSSVQREQEEVTNWKAYCYYSDV